MKSDVCTYSVSNLIGFEADVSIIICIKMLENYPKRLAAVSAAKCGSINACHTFQTYFTHTLKKVKMSISLQINARLSSSKP